MTSITLFEVDCRRLLPNEIQPVSQFWSCWDWGEIFFKFQCVPSFISEKHFRIIIPLINTETPTSPRIIIIRPGAYDPEKFKVPDTVKINVMIQDLLAMEDDQYVICGVVSCLILVLLPFQSRKTLLKILHCTYRLAYWTCLMLRLDILFKCSLWS